MRELCDRRHGDRGVSDLVGFAVIFGVVILSITLIYTVGLTALDDLQHDEAMNNAGRAFDIVAENLADIHQDGAPARSTELQFGGGQVSLTGQAKIELVARGTAGPGVNISSSTPITYHSRETAFYYVSGAVIRSDRGNSVMVLEPPFRFGADRTVISLVKTRAAGDTDSIGGQGTARLAAKRQVIGSPARTGTVRNGTNDVTFNVSVTSPGYRAWGRYFEHEGLTREEVDAANNTVVYSHTTSELYVRKTTIEVRLTP